MSSCVSCGATDKPLSACSRCEMVWYCGVECQKLDWKLNAHKQACEKLRFDPKDYSPENEEKLKLAFGLWLPTASFCLKVLGSHLVPKTRCRDVHLLVMIEYADLNTSVLVKQTLPITRAEICHARPHFLPVIDAFVATTKGSQLLVLLECGNTIATGLTLDFAQGEWEQCTRVTLDEALQDLQISPSTVCDGKRLTLEVSQFKSSLGKLMLSGRYFQWLSAAMRWKTNQPLTHTHCLLVRVVLALPLYEIKQLESFQVITLDEAIALCGGEEAHLLSAPSSSVSTRILFMATNFIHAHLQEPFPMSSSERMESIQDADSTAHSAFRALQRLF
ncbi:hypothetical protein BASA81_001827 [Batrachochytrium salamandrivorans]|nr:hypothetical protein BASA81_001827 [Batrachochytrium salamandrivorans]